ncbi:MAG: nitrile hydratase subunit beta [Beijerinckiaceae bacterium]|nr:nitrile hydratase subunit beta [Beijerinckiaceae bacterium]
MNGGQDLGGMMGLGPIQGIDERGVFHGRWESRVLAINVAVGAAGCWNIDMSRHAREAIPPAEYMTSKYYVIWLKALERLTVEKGLLTADELELGKALTPPRPVKTVMKAADVAPSLARGWPADRPAASEPLFAPGDAVRMKNMHPSGHTRLPRYVRGRLGTVKRVHGFHVFPDSNAAGKGEDPHWLYCVSFNGRELWGADGDPATDVSVDAWEPYLERA